MRYFRSQTNFHQYEPKKKWWSFFKRKRGKLAPTNLPQKNHFIQLKENGGGLFKKIQLPLLLILWAGLLMHVPYFRVTKISYQGLKIIKQPEIEQLLKERFLNKKRLVFPADNYFLVDEKKLANFLQTIYSLNTIQVKKIFPNKLSIELEESISSVIYDDGQAYFLLDQNGTAIKRLKGAAPDEYKTIATAVSSTAMALGTTTSTFHTPDFYGVKKEFGNYPLVYSLSGATTTEKQLHILKPELIEGIIEAYNSLPKSGVGSIKYFTIDNPEAGITAVSGQRWKVHLQPLANIPNQLNHIKIVLQTNHPNEYIDVRFGDHVYWK